MDDAKRKALEAAGFHIGDPEEFLHLTEEERRLVEQQLAARRSQTETKPAEDDQ
jgi:hypothetical protein